MTMPCLKRLKVRDRKEAELKPAVIVTNMIKGKL